MTKHLMRGECPDENQPDARDSCCVACLSMNSALMQSGKLAEDRLQQINADRAQALLWKSLLRECQAHLACNAVNDDLVALYGRVRAALGEA